MKVRGLSTVTARRVSAKEREGRDGCADDRMTGQLGNGQEGTGGGIREEREKEMEQRKKRRGGGYQQKSLL